MYALYCLLSQILRLASTRRLAARTDGIARQLLESAEARAGLNPQQAQELRGAALAYLRVVR
jgi:regulator of sirC expression with transglutaminase-like and TPR domain